jgi:hypothetical protein
MRMTSPSGEKERRRFQIAKHMQSQNPEYNSQFNGWTNHDTWNTMLILENDQRSYRWLQEWRKNWERKIKGGRFNQEEAEFAVWKYIVPAARGQGRAHDWKAGRTWDENMRPYYEDEFVGDDRIDRDNVDYASVVRHILEIGD